MANTTSLIAGAAMFLATGVYADRVNHDVTGYDIAGITLGMGAEEAMEKVADLTGLPVEELNTGYKEANRVTGNDEITSISAKTTDFEIRVSLTAAVPPSEETPLVVSQISFQMPRTPENMTTMRARAFEKYGLPTDGSVDDPDHFDLAWCTIPADRRTASCASGVGAKLSLGGGMSGLRSMRELNLFDISYADAVRDYLNEENSSAPKF